MRQNMMTCIPAHGGSKRSPHNGPQRGAIMNAMAPKHATEAHDVGR